MTLLYFFIDAYRLSLIQMHVFLGRICIRRLQCTAGAQACPEARSWPLAVTMKQHILHMLSGLNHGVSNCLRGSSTAAARSGLRACRRATDTVPTVPISRRYTSGGQLMAASFHTFHSSHLIQVLWQDMTL